jgi:hypothetical protein
MEIFYFYNQIKKILLKMIKSIRSKKFCNKIEINKSLFNITQRNIKFVAFSPTKGYVIKSQLKAESEKSENTEKQEKQENIYTNNSIIQLNSVTCIMNEKGFKEILSHKLFLKKLFESNTK